MARNAQSSLCNPIDRRRWLAVGTDTRQPPAASPFRRSAPAGRVCAPLEPAAAIGCAGEWPLARRPAAGSEGHGFQGGRLRCKDPVPVCHDNDAVETLLDLYVGASVDGPVILEGAPGPPYPSLSLWGVGQHQLTSTYTESGISSSASSARSSTTPAPSPDSTSSQVGTSASCSLLALSYG